jgi:predicted nucleic acid-binding protein
MPVAIDTSVLISVEKEGRFDDLLPESDDGPFYIPAPAAPEFLVGIHPPVRLDLRQRAAQLCQSRFRSLVSAFTETDAAQLAALISELRTKGEHMKFFDAAIAATVMARGDKLWRWIVILSGSRTEFSLCEEDYFAQCLLYSIRILLQQPAEELVAPRVCPPPGITAGQDFSIVLPQA